jgi:hypothetical protein
MTAQTVAPWCPDWCAETNDNRVCSSEHYADVGCVPASGAASTAEYDGGTGATFPTVGIALIHSVPDGDDAPAVSLYLSGGTPECQVYMRPSEARRLIALMQTALHHLS